MQWVGVEEKEVYTPSFPDKKYKIIYADPPWTYRDKAAAGKRGSSFKYTTMKIEDIYNLPVQEIAAEDCILFIWGTWPLISYAFNTITAWGFGYKTLGFIWVKRNKNFFKNFKGFLKELLRGKITVEQFLNLITTKYFWGGGSYTRANSEFVLIATKGNVKRISASVHQVIDHPQTDEHSEKPAVIRNKIVELMGDLPRIELFAREEAEGWDSWGLEV